MNKTAKDLWKPKKRIELLYKRSLKQAISKLESKIKNLTSLSDILREIRNFVNDKEFIKYAEATARKMVTHLFTDAGHTWRKAAKENSKGKIIYEALKKELQGPIGGAVNYQVQRNAEIIKTLPLDISQQVTKHIAEESMKGKRASQIADEIKEYFPHVTEAKAKLISRTEVSKTSTALTKARSDKLGIRAYIWTTSEDSRVRTAHAKMDDVICFFDEPIVPEKIFGMKSNLYPGLAGEFPNCRCFASPIINLDLITWPHKVCYRNKIVTMSRKQFESIM